METKLGKMVDLVTLGITEYLKNKRKTYLISAKTSLRERWQEVPEELGRTGAGEMFLITLDAAASKKVLDQLYEQNIQLVTTHNIKQRAYRNNDRVLTFADLLLELKKNYAYWAKINYTATEIAQQNSIIEKQLKSTPLINLFLKNTKRWKRTL